jgi:hypothetical protein
MATRDFLMLAASSTATVDPQVNYAGAGYQVNGFQPGITLPAEFNKAIRQGTAGMAVLSQLIVNTLGVSVLDTGYASEAAEVNALVAQLLSTLQNIASANAITSLTGDVSASGPGTTAAILAASGVTAGTYTGATVTVDAKGRVTSAIAGYTSGSNANGYWEKSPTGHIHQWGSVTVNVSASLYGTATLPIAFTSHFDSIIINSNYGVISSTLLTPSNLPIPASAPHAGSLSQYDWHFESNVGNAFSGNLVFSFVADGY